MNIRTEEFQEFVEALEIIDDEDMRFEYIIDIGKKASEEPFPDMFRTESNLMHGCMSKVWIVGEQRDGRHYFKGDSDAIIVKGLVVMMTRSFSGMKKNELQDVSIEDVKKLNLGALTTQRQVGMMGMLEHFQKLSEQLDSKID